MTPLWNQIAGNSLSDQQLQQLDRYLDLLIEKNQVLNLTRITDRAEAEIKHVADALTLLKYLPPAQPGRKLTLADVGTGGGIPGVILAVARPDLSVTLIDATKKKLDAVQSMCEQIGLTNTRTLHARIESIDEKFDILTTRAVANLDTLLGWCERRMKRSSLLLALKGPRVTEEAAALSPRTRRSWQIQINAADVAELPGHQIVVARSIKS